MKVESYELSIYLLIYWLKKGARFHPSTPLIPTITMRYCMYVAALVGSA